MKLTAKQRRRNRIHGETVKANHGGKRCFGASTPTGNKQSREIGALARFDYGRGTMNGKPIY